LPTSQDADNQPSIQHCWTSEIPMIGSSDSVRNSDSESFGCSRLEVQALNFNDWQCQCGQIQFGKSDLVNGIYEILWSKCQYFTLWISHWNVRIWIT
jgi:hypothetical protein